VRALCTREVAVWALLALLLIWPAIYNRQGIFFFDTITYVRGADTGIVALLHHRSHWSVPSGAVVRAAPASAPAAAGKAPVKDTTVLIGRSWFYGALVYAGDLLGGFWLTLVVQAAAAVAAIALTLAALRLPRIYVLPVGIVLALLSSLPFYVSFLMPDVFTGIVIAGGAVLLTRELALERWQLVAWWLLLAAGALFHDTHLLILCTLFVAALALRLLPGKRVNPSGMLVIFLAIMIGILGQIAFVLGVKRWYGVAPMNPPFLTARLIEDGTGVEYLRATCPGNGFQVCRYLDRLPMAADDFLWQTRPDAGVFASASPEAKRRLSAEQVRLAAAVFAFDPLGQVLASLRNAALQLASSGLWEFEYPDEEKATFDQKFPRDLLARLHASAAYQRRMPIATFELILTASFYGSVCFIAAALLWPKTRAALGPAIVGASAWLLTGVLVNAVICGVLSGPHERYSARVQWLLPLMAMLVLSGLLAARAHRVSPRVGRSPEPAVQRCAPRPIDKRAVSSPRGRD